MARYRTVKATFTAPKIKIKRQYNPYAYKTTQAGRTVKFGQAIDMSKHDPTVLTKVYRKKLATPRRLYVRDPYNLNSVSGIMATGRTQATFSPEADTFTNNPNPKYDPSKHPTVVSAFGQRDLAKEVPGKASRGHANVIPRTLFNQNQGKRLRRV